MGDLKNSLDKLLKTLLVSSLALTSGCAFIQDSILCQKRSRLIVPSNYNINRPDSKANELLINFPSKLEGAKSIDKYLTPNAKYCLVHIRSVHLCSYDSIPEKVNSVQSDIYSILSDLIQRKLITQVYLEGVTLSNEEQINLIYSSHLSECEGVEKEIEANNTLLKRLNERDELYLKYDMVPPNKGNDQKKVKTELIFLKDKLKEIYNFKNKIGMGCAVTQLALDGKISIVSAESDSVAIISRKMLKDFMEGITLIEPKFAIYDAREDDLLNLISLKDNPLNVTVYGGNHMWGGRDSFKDDYLEYGRFSLEDNIAKWNHSNPSKKFSLIEITPLHYKNRKNNLE